MSCNKSKKEVLKNINDSIKTNRDAPDFDSSGNSRTLANEVLKTARKLVGDPKRFREFVNNINESVGGAYYKSLKTHLGDTITISSEGKNKDYFILGAEYSRNDGQASIDLKIAPTTNLQKPQKITVNTRSDNIVSGDIEGSIRGIADIAQYALVSLHKSERPTKNIPTTERDNSEEGFGQINKAIDLDNALGSNYFTGDSTLQGFEKIEGYRHGDIDSMVEIMHKLHILGNSKATPDQIKYYENLLRSMHQRWFNEVELFIDKQGDLTEGFVNIDKKQIAIRVNKDKSKLEPQSEAEVYMHEVLHTIFSAILMSSAKGVSQIKIELNHLINKVHENTTWEDFLRVPKNEATERDIQFAKNMYEYAFSSRNHQHEFLAFALTNPYMIEKLKGMIIKDTEAPTGTMLGKFVHVLSKLINSLMGRMPRNMRGITAYEHSKDIVTRLAEINSAQKSNLSKLNPIGAIMNVLSSGDKYTVSKFKQLSKKILQGDLPKKLDKDSSLFQEAKFHLSILARGLLGEQHYRKIWGLQASLYGIKPDNMIREYFGSLFEKEDIVVVAENMQLLSNNLEATRNSSMISASRLLASKFKKPLSEQEDSDVYNAWLSTDLARLKYSTSYRRQKSDKEIRKWLTDKEALKADIKNLQNKIYKHVENQGEDIRRARWTINQTAGLGMYMAKGVTSLTLNKNYNNILNLKGIPPNVFGKVNQGYSSGKMLALIEELSIAQAVLHSETKAKETVAGLLSIKDTRDGMNALADTHYQHSINSLNKGFNGNPIHMESGYTVEVFDDSIGVEIAPVSEKAQMAVQGYTLQKELRSNRGHDQKVKMGIYTTGTFGRPERLKGAIALGNLNSKGTTLRELKRIDHPNFSEAAFEADFNAVKVEALQEHINMMNGTHNWAKVEKGLSPLYNDKGEIIDFRYTMDKKTKITALGMNTSAIDVLSRAESSLMYKTETEKLNGEILNYIKTDMETNLDDRLFPKDGLTEYTIITKNSPSKKIRDMYYLLPKSFKDYAESRDDKSIAVRTALINTFFGYKHIQWSNAPLVKYLPQAIKHGINITQGIWESLIKISKGAILIKMPAILGINIVSNMWQQAVLRSESPMSVISDYKVATRELDEFIQTQKKITTLEHELEQDRAALNRVRDKTKLKEIVNKKEVELKRLNRVIEDNPAKELMDAGMYQSYLLDSSDSTLDDTNRISKAATNALNKAPLPARKAAEWAYLTSNTSWYKFSQEVMQRTDMIARMVANKRMIKDEIKQIDGKDALPEWWLEKKPFNYPKKKKLGGEERKQFLEASKFVRHKTLMDEYLNYVLPNGPFEEHLNRIGVLLFSKYIKRVQKMIKKHITEAPLSTMLIWAAISNFSIMGFIGTSSIAYRIFGEGEVDLSNAIPVWSPAFHGANLAIPPLFKDESQVGKIF